MHQKQKHQLFRHIIAFGTTPVPCIRVCQQTALILYPNQPKCKLGETSKFTLNLASPKSQIFTSKL